MGIASFVIGLICLILSPFLNIFLILPSILALVLGIVDCIIKSKKKQSKGFSVAGIVLSVIALVLSILFLVFFIFAFDSLTDNILNVANSLADEVEILQSTTTYGVGESATIDDIKITLTSVDKDFKDYYSYASVDDDYTILKADFELENVGDYTEYVYYSDFTCYADQFSCDNFTYVEDGYFSESLSSGRKTVVSVYFEVPEDTDSIEIEFEPSYDSKITFDLSN